MTTEQASAAKVKHRVLVLGDPMIDRTWVVTEPAQTSQVHAEIAPQAVVNPKARDTRPGGAGLTAAWLAKDPDVEVLLLAQVGSELRRLLEDAQVKLHDGLVVAANHRDTTKFRVYAYRGEDQMPLMKHRFDLDCQAGDWQLPGLESFRPELVVIADFMKGAVNADRWNALAGSASAVPWLVDSKNPLILEHRVDASGPRPTLFVNRAEFAALVARHLQPEGSGSSRPIRLDGPWHHIETQVLKAAGRFAGKFANWDLVVKLEADGAVAFWKPAGGAWQFAHRKAVERRGQVVGIGAGDAFLAGWAAATLDDLDHEHRLDRAIGHAVAWIASAEASPQLTWPSDVTPKTMAKFAPAASKPTPTAAAVNTSLKKLRGSQSLKGLIASGAIDLRRAGGHCGKFMTLNVGVGNNVRSFAAEVKAFFDSKGQRHPLNALVWARPGSGKSFLVEELAGHVGAKFVEINVAQMISFEALRQAIERARGQDEEAVLVMIDEFAALIAGQRVLSALLAPLWSKTKTKRMAFVLVDSYNGHGVKSAESFMQAMRERPNDFPKGADLVSRINGPVLSLESPDKVDRAVLVASLMRRLHAGTAFGITVAALDALVENQVAPHWSPRAVEYIVEAVVPVGGAVRLQDLRRLDDMSKRLGIQLPDVDDTRLVRIVGP